MNKPRVEIVGFSSENARYWKDFKQSMLIGVVETPTELDQKVNKEPAIVGFEYLMFFDSNRADLGVYFNAESYLGKNIPKQEPESEVEIIEFALG